MQYSIPDKFIVTIDGMGGTGKDTLAANLSASNIFQSTVPFILNQGDLVRAVAYQLRSSIITTEKVLMEMRNLDFHAIDRNKIFSSEIGKKASQLVTVPGLVEALVENTAMTLRSANSSVCLVLGRICGNTIEAQEKLYLHASMEICAHRRAKEMAAKGETYESAYQSLIKRNLKDKENLGDLILPAKDAKIIDAEGSVEDVLYEARNIILPVFEKWSLGQ